MSDRSLFPNKEKLGQDGSVRKAHYRLNEKGEEPWDTMLRCGWAWQFAAACVLRYLRRDKDMEHSVESARWYYAQLKKAATAEIPEARPHVGPIEAIFNTLANELTVDEIAAVHQPEKGSDDEQA